MRRFFVWERGLRRNREGGAAGGVPPPQRASPARPAVFGSAKGSAPAPEPDKPRFAASQPPAHEKGKTHIQKQPRPVPEQGYRREAKNTPGLLSRTKGI